MITPGSCVPAVPGFEDTGSKIDADDIRETMTWDSVVGLGEMMNDPGVLGCQDNPIDEINETLKAGKIVTGHLPYPIRTVCLRHTSRPESRAATSPRMPMTLRAKIRMGQYALMREGSAWHNLRELSKAIVGRGIDTRLVCLVSDEQPPRDARLRGAPRPYPAQGRRVWHRSDHCYPDGHHQCGPVLRDGG